MALRFALDAVLGLIASRRIFSALICSPVRPLDVVAVCRPMPAESN
jgi:hypothetical protein